MATADGLDNCVCMIYDDHGNAFDAFPFEPEDLDDAALRLREARGELTWVTMKPNPWTLSGPEDRRDDG